MVKALYYKYQLHDHRHCFLCVPKRSSRTSGSSEGDSSPVKTSRRRVTRVLEDSSDEGEATKTQEPLANGNEEGKVVKAEHKETHTSKNGHSESDKDTEQEKALSPSQPLPFPKRKTG